MASPPKPNSDERDGISPREFMRARRPGKFSDSLAGSSPRIDRPLLEFQLDTLTTRSEENLFANFAFQLAKREICPNLLPQTGPVGGGDSKVDSETVPTADALSLAWHPGVGREAASERWGFAFSAKKDWRTKLKSDVAKLAGTGRGYQQAFFITNQAVPDKKRAAIEDELRKKHGLDVRVLDRTWILDRVFTNRHEELAIQELHLSVSHVATTRKGPKDTERENELHDLQQRIAAAVASGSTDFQFVEDCLETALLARGLERPRTEVEGLLDRAERVAKEHGTSHQRLVSYYNHAWTAFWWFEDYALLNSLYAEVEALAEGSRNAYELELLHNLWTVLRTAVSSGGLTDSEAALTLRRASLAGNLERLAAEVDRPSTALQARTHLLQMQLFPESGRAPDEVFVELQGVVREAKALVGYPFDTVVTLLTELGTVFGHLPAYEALFEDMAASSARRDGEMSRARLLAERGRQQLASERPYEAIRSLGRALEDLYKFESRDDIVRVLYMCSAAYERAGLLWAARGAALQAASIATNEFWTYENITSAQTSCYSRMKWLELRLGRVPQSLAWFELEATMRQIRDRASGHDSPSDEMVRFDGVLSVLFLKADLLRLARVSHLPDALDGLGLFNSAVVLRYSLGYEDEIPDAYGAGSGPDAVGFFRMCRDQPAWASLPVHPELAEGSTMSLRASILGCTINLQTPTDRVCVELSEALLAAVESFASTVFAMGGVAREPQFTVDVSLGSPDEPLVSFAAVDAADGRPSMSIRCADMDFRKLTRAHHEEVQGVLASMVAHVFGRVLVLADIEANVVKLMRDERAMVRAVPFAASYFASSNVLGHDARVTSASWKRGRDYVPRRSEEWDAEDRRARAARASEPTATMSPGTGEPPAGIFDVERLRHDNVEVRSNIRDVLWDRAGWRGVAYRTTEGDRSPPVMALMFTSKEAAAAIFSGWRKEMGDVDENDDLRIVIVRGVNQRCVHHYRVVIGTNRRKPAEDRSMIVAMSRIHLMEALTPENVDRFLASYQKVGWFILGYAIVEKDGVVPALTIADGIAKRHLGVRQAWEIGWNDVDMVGVLAGDEPIIPTDRQQDAPVLELLRMKRERLPE